MDEADLSTGFGNLSIFNSRLRDDDYHWDVVAWREDGLLPGSLQGDLLAGGATVCAGDVFAVLGPWGTPGADPVLNRVDAGSASLSVERVGLVDLPGRRRMLETLGLVCVGEQLYLMKSDRARLYLGIVDVRDASVRWRRVDSNHADPAGMTPCGVIGQSVYFLGHDTQLLSVVDFERSSAVEHLAEVPGDGSKCSVDGGRVLVYTERLGDDPELHWYDENGKLADEIVIRGLGRYLEDAGEFVSSEPVSLQ